MLVQIQGICRRQNKGYSKTEIALERVENIVGKRKNAGSQHFYFFPQCIRKATSAGSIKVDCVVELNVPSSKLW